MSLTRREILQRGVAMLTAGVAVKPKPPTFIDQLNAACRRTFESGQWKGILAGIDFAQDPDNAFITIGRLSEDGKHLEMESFKL